MDNSNNDVSGNINVSILEVPQLSVNNDNTIVIDDTNTVDVKNNTDTQFDYKESKQFIIFKNELESLINNNLYILKECKSNKRLLDIKYANLTNKVNYIQISVSCFIDDCPDFYSQQKSIFIHQIIQWLYVEYLYLHILV